MENIMNGYLISPLQERAWDIRKEGRAFNNLLGVELTGMLDKEKLTAAFTKIVQRHEIFRTTYLEQPDFKYPLQIVNEEGIFELREENISGLAAGARQEWLQKFQQLLVSKDFNIDTCGVLGACLVQLTGADYMLYIFCPPVAGDIDTLLNVVKELKVFLKACNVCDKCNAACIGDKKNNDPEDNLQFVQYSEWQNEMLDEYNQEAESFWKESANELYSKDKLPLQSVYNGKPGNKISSIQVPLCEADKQLIDSYINAAGKNKASYMFACWLALVWHHLGLKEEVVVGKSISGRVLDAFRAINGAMVKVLPFLCRIEPHSSLEQLYGKVRAQEEKCLAFQDHFDFTLAAHNKSDFADISFEHIYLPTTADRVSGISFNTVTAEAYPDTFKIKLTLTEEAKGYALSLKFHDHYFSVEAAQAMAGQLAVLMVKAAEAPTKPIDELLDISTWEKDMVLNRFNNTNENFAPSTIIDLFEAQVAAAPLNTAVSAEGQTLNYEELSEQANRIAAHLAGVHGVKKGDVVAVKMKRSALMIASILGVLKAGGVFLPVDSNTPLDRFLFITEDSKCGFILTDESVPAETDSKLRVIILRDLLLLPREGGVNTMVNPVVTDAAYIIYTSGSTGKPKGTIISHGAFSNYLQWVKSAFAVSSSDRMLFFLSVAFDLGYTSLWPALISGSTVYVLKETPHLEPDKLVDALIEKEITFIKLTPSHFSLITDDPAFSKHVMEYSFRIVVLGGEKIKSRDIEKYIQYRKDTHFVNHYGPTETTVGVIAGEIDIQNFGTYIQTPVIGKPISNNKVLILTENNCLAPIGISGEICISGAGLSDGYFGKADLTAEKFVPNPFMSDQLMYKTGDLGRWLADGSIQLIGRNDSQVKIRGFRVETGEIEKVLLQDDAIQSALVLSVEDESGELYLKAFVIPQHKPFYLQELKDRMSRQLPDYMIPAAFIQTDEFPLLANGKIDRNALLTIKDTQMESEINFEAPKNETEEAVAAIWQRILQKDAVSTNVSFFNIGGNSLKLVKVFRELAKLYPGRLTLNELFKYSSIQAISEYLDAPAESDNAPVTRSENVVEGFDF
jgi:amino acid adenylation domain-containing protein